MFDYNPFQMSKRISHVIHFLMWDLLSLRTGLQGSAERYHSLALAIERGGEGCTCCHLCICTSPQSAQWWSNVLPPDPTGCPPNEFQDMCVCMSVLHLQTVCLHRNRNDKAGLDTKNDHLSGIKQRLNVSHRCHEAPTTSLNQNNSCF